MKKFLIVSCMMSLLVLSGCSLSGITTSIAQKIDDIIKKDQTHEQGFEVTKEILYDHFDIQAKRIDLSDTGLIAVPDICALLDPKDYTNVRWLNVSKNNIRLLNTDLSCLKFLRSLDLSYNQIEAVQTLGSLPALQELNMEHNDLTTTENFPDLPMLEKLYLSYNKIKEVKDLDHLKNLIILELQNNVIEYIVGVENLKQLKQLKIDYDKVKAGDLTPILDTLKDLELVDSVGNVLGDTLKEKLKNKLPF